MFRCRILLELSWDGLQVLEDFRNVGVVSPSPGVLFRYIPEQVLGVQLRQCWNLDLRRRTTKCILKRPTDSLLSGSGSLYIAYRGFTGS